MMIVSLILIKKFCKTKKSQNITIIVSAGILLGLIIFNRISLSAHRGNWLRLIPASFCGTTSLVFSVVTIIFVLKFDLNHAIFHFLVYIAIAGGALTIIAPSFLGQADSIFHLRTISGLLHHSMSLYLAILIIMLGRFKPSIKRIHCFWLGLTVYMTWGLFLIHAIGLRDAMNINFPAASGIYWYVAGGIILTIHFVFLVVYELVRKKISFATCD